MKGFETEVQQKTCIECGADFEDGYRDVCLDCMKIKADWFWTLWRQTHNVEDEAAGEQPPA